MWVFIVHITVSHLTPEIALYLHKTLFACALLPYNGDNNDDVSLITLSFTLNFQPFLYKG